MHSQTSIQRTRRILCLCAVLLNAHAMSCATSKECPACRSLIVSDFEDMDGRSFAFQSILGFSAVQSSYWGYPFGGSTHVRLDKRGYISTLGHKIVEIDIKYMSRALAQRMLREHSKDIRVISCIGCLEIPDEIIVATRRLFHRPFLRLPGFEGGLRRLQQLYLLMGGYIGVDLTGCHFKSDDLQFATVLRKLRYIIIRNARVPEEMIEKLASMPRLSALDLAGTHLSDEGFRRIARNRSIRHLNVVETGISSAVWSRMEMNHNIRTMLISSASVSGSLNRFGNIFRRLKELHFPDGVEGLSGRLAHIGSLETLVIGRSGSIDASLLGGLHNLKVLQIHDPFRAELADAIGGMRKLKEIIWKGEKHCDTDPPYRFMFDAPSGRKATRRSFVDMLREIEGVEVVEIDGLSPGEDALVGIDGLRKLRRLVVTNTVVGVRELESISKSSSIQELQLRGAGIGDAEVAKLGKMRLRALVLDENNITWRAMKYIERMTCLRTLSLSNTSVGTGESTRQTLLRPVVAFRAAGLKMDRNFVEMMKQMRSAKYFDLSGSDFPPSAEKEAFRKHRPEAVILF